MPYFAERGYAVSREDLDMFDLKNVDLLKEIKGINIKYNVKRLTVDDVLQLYDFCKANTTYYRYMRMEPNVENVSENFTMLPPNKDTEDKFFVGFYEGDVLVAILDIVRGWPREDIAYIGWFMVNKDKQGKGVGNILIDETIRMLKDIGFKSAMLGCIKDNIEAYRFWTKKGFKEIGKEVDKGDYIIMNMEKRL